MPKPTVLNAVFCKQGLESRRLTPVESADSVCHALTLNDVQSNSDRMVVKEVFVDCETLTGKQFTVDACCSDDGVNSHCAVFYSPAKSFLYGDVCGQHVWLCPPVARVERFVKRYLKCKSKSPHNTSACIAVPAFHSAQWRKLLQGMQLIKQYAKGSMLFAEAGHGSTQRALGPSPWDYEVYYDPPLAGPVKPATPHEMCLHATGDVGQLLMSFPGVVSDCPACIIADSGASHEFIDRAFVVKHGLREYAASGSVSVAGQKSVPVAGFVRARVKCQGLSEVIKMYVVDMPSPNLHVVLGQSWLRSHNAVISYADKCVRFWQGGRRSVLKCVCDDDPVLPPPPALPSHSLTYMQFQEAVKEKDARYFVVNVMAADERVAEAAEEGAVPEPNCNLRFKPVLHPVVESFADVFAELPPGLPPDRGVGHTINTGDSPPVSKPMYRLSPKEKAEVERQLADLVEKGFVQPSHSAWGAPVIFVAKKSGDLRMCVDYRALNQVTVKDKYPLPRIDDLLDRLQGARVFSSLDLQSGYHQVRIADEDVPKTAFRTHKGLFEFRVLSFGLTNAPAVFQREMNRVLADLPFVLVYLDDILVFSKSAEEHAEHLKQVLARLREHKLYAKMAKCFFFRDSVEFLGHVVSADGVQVDPKKVSVIREWPPLRDVHAVQQFLGLGNYFKHYIQGYAKLVAPLRKLTEKSVPFAFEGAAVKAFENLKYSLSHAPVLALPDPDLPFEVVVDASGFGCGAVLLQNQRPVAFHSYKFSSAERNYSGGEQELLITALRQWRCHLEGAKEVVVVTDHKPNTYLDSKPSVQLSRRQVRWQEFLSRFDFKWEYRKGSANVADPISRCSSLMCTLMSMLAEWAPAGAGDPSVPGGLLRQVENGYASDEWFADEKHTAALTFGDGVWRRGSQIVVPDVDDLRQKCLSLHHDTPFAGHLGRDRTMQLVLQTYWWPGLERDVRQYVSTCDHCQRDKASSEKPAGLLHHCLCLSLGGSG